MKKLFSILVVLLLMLLPFAQAEVIVVDDIAEDDVTGVYVQYGESYNTDLEVGLYLHVFRELPANYLTKNEAKSLGWVSSQGNLWDVAYGMSIGGDTFGNREGKLPAENGRTWTECDINYEGGFRGSDRVVFSSDGLIYSSVDHYTTFNLLYDGWYEYEEEEDAQ